MIAVRSGRTPANRFAAASRPTKGGFFVASVPLPLMLYWGVLTSERQSLTLFHWGIGEHDRHLLQRMRNTGVQRIAVSVFGHNQVYCNYAYQTVHDDLGHVPVDFFDCLSPGCWVHPSLALV